MGAPGYCGTCTPSQTLGLITSLQEVPSATEVTFLVSRNQDPAISAGILQPNMPAGWGRLESVPQVYPDSSAKDSTTGLGAEAQPLPSRWLNAPLTQMRLLSSRD